MVNSLAVLTPFFGNGTLEPFRGISASVLASVVPQPAFNLQIEAARHGRDGCRTRRRDVPCSTEKTGNAVDHETSTERVDPSPMEGQVLVRKERRVCRVEHVCRS